MNQTLPPSGPDTERVSGITSVVRLSHLGVIRVEGEDAAKFLHGQLTQDFSLLGPDQARLCAFCSAKGRMQASFIGFKRSQTDILLVCSLDLLATTLKRLSMFVMRAKARLTDATQTFAIYGICSPATEGAGHEAPWTHRTEGDASLVQLYPADNVSRMMWVAPAEVAAPRGTAMSLDHWLWTEVRSGIATLTQPLFEAFVPQMLNYESVGGVNFKKGCYPGQEVVARSLFRGTLKRRAFIVHSEDTLHAGQEVFSSTDPEQPAGLVVQAAKAPQAGFDAIVSLQLVAVDAGTLHTESSTGPAITLLPLPYALLQDI